MNCLFLIFLVSVFCSCGAEQNSGNSNASFLDLGDRYGKTPLHLSIQRGYNNLTRLLVAAGANLSATSENGDTPLHKAVIYKNMYAVKLLLENKVNVNVKNEHGESPLFVASLSNSCKIAKILIEHGAKIDDVEKSALAIAIANDHADMLDVFLNSGVSVNYKIGNKFLIELALFNGADKVAKLLLDSGANYTITNEDGESLLYMAVYNGNLEMAELIINSTRSSVSENKHPNAY